MIDGALTEVRAGRLAARSRRGRATFTCARGEVEGGGGGRVSRALPVAGAGEAGRGPPGSGTGTVTWGARVPALVTGGENDS